MIRGIENFTQACQGKFLSTFPGFSKNNKFVINVIFIQSRVLVDLNLNELLGFYYI